MKKEIKNCWNCQFAKDNPGDCHITCSNPPKNRLEIGAGGDERYIKAEKMAKENKAVVRCIWPGSGFFPLIFDSNTVFGCDNYKEKSVG